MSREQMERFLAGREATADRLFSLKVLGLGVAKGAGKVVLLKRLGAAARAVALRVVVIGGVAYVLIEVGHASKELEDGTWGTTFRLKNARIILPE